MTLPQSLPSFRIENASANSPEQLPVLPALPSSASGPTRPRQLRTRTQSYIDAVRTSRGLLEDHLPPRHKAALATSSQHVLATALRRDPQTAETMSLNAITIGFSLLPQASASASSSPTPSWIVTLPSPSIPPLKNRPAHRKSHQPLCPAEVDHLLFSPDGTHLLVCSHTSAAHPGLGHLRLSMLLQSNSKADQWSLIWDEVVCDFSVRNINDREPLEPKVKRVIKARFLGEPRRWFYGPADPTVPEEESVLIGSTRYRRPQKTCGASINGFALAKGATAIMVLNTNELFVVYIPFKQTKLPPHVLLTTMNNSSIASGPLRLIPTPGANRQDRKRTITVDTELPLAPLAESAVALLSYPERPEHGQTHGNTLVAKSCQNMSESSIASTQTREKLMEMLGICPPDTSASSAVNAHGETSVHFNASPINAFEMQLNHFRSARKEITVAAIGFPAQQQQQQQQSVDVIEPPSTPVEDPMLLIAFQTRTKPIIPIPVKQVVLPPMAVKNQEGAIDHEIQFSIGVEDDYITGLGDLDDAFDTPKDTVQASGVGITGEGTGADAAQQQVEKEQHLAGKRKAQCELRKQLQINRRRFEPVLGIDESADQAGAGDKATFGFVEVVEVFFDFENELVPTISLQPLPSVPILDPADSTIESRLTIRSLEFLEPDLERGGPELQLLAGYSRELEDCLAGGLQQTLEESEENKSVDELQVWDIRHTKTELSSGFMGLDCLVAQQRKVDGLLRGPVEWAFVRSSRKRLLMDEEAGTTKLAMKSVIPSWRARPDSLLLVVGRSKIGLDGEEEVKLECQVLNRRDLSLVTVKTLSLMTDREAHQVAVSYNGVWACSVDKKGKVRALPLLSPRDSPTIVGLVMSAIYNRGQVDDIAKLLSAADGEDGFELSWIFEQISHFIASRTAWPRNFEADPLLANSMSIGHNLWRACPTYKPAAEIALLTRQLATVFTVGCSLQSEALPRSGFQLLSFLRWYVNLCKRILEATNPESSSPYLCLLPTTSCTFFYLYKLALFFKSCRQIFLNENLDSTILSNTTLPVFEGVDEMSLEEEYDKSRRLFNDYWDERSPINFESWSKCLVELGPKVLFASRPGGPDLTKIPKRQIEFFSGPLAAVDPSQVSDAVNQFRQVTSLYPETLKQQAQTSTTAAPAATTVAVGTPTTMTATGTTTTRATLDEKDFDIITTARLLGPPRNIKLCAQCGGKSIDLISDKINGLKRTLKSGDRIFSGKFIGVLGPAEWVWTEFTFRCICSGLWVSVVPPNIQVVKLV